ncbi:MAG: DUF3857 domain-containing protein, partial [Bacteroidales bacterium]|nr:DUF3857 domain-containing protein [Bacteroidales bacterium]
ETQSYLPSGFLYRDDQYKLVVYPMIAEGSITILDYTKHIQDPRFISPFFFPREIPVLEAAFSVTLDEGIEVGWNIFGTDSISINRSETYEKGRRTITWKASSIKAFHEEKDGPSGKEIKPNIILFVKSAQFKDGRKTYLGDVADLYQWYYQLLNRTNKKNQKELKEFTQNLTKECLSETDKIRTVFQWVQKNIKYIAVFEGLGGLIPEDCVDVFRTRYGDCKGMANLTQQMLESIGINSFIAWVGTRDIPYSYTANPTLATDNHMILACYKDGIPKILDPTNRYGSFSIPPYYLQGKQTLISKNDSLFEIYEIPVAQANRNLKTDLAELTLEDNSLIGHSNILLTGYCKNSFENDFTKVNTREEDFINEKFTNGYNKTEISNIILKGLYDRFDTLLIGYDLKMEEYAKNIGSKYFINLNLNKTLSNTTIDIEKRKYDYILDFLRTDHSIVKVAIPEGYEAEYVPESTHFQNDLVSFDIKYSIEDRRIVMDKNIELKTLRVTTDDFDQWNQAIQKLNEAYQEVITISKH